MEKVSPVWLSPRGLDRVVFRPFVAGDKMNGPPLMLPQVQWDKVGTIKDLILIGGIGDRRGDEFPFLDQLYDIISSSVDVQCVTLVGTGIELDDVLEFIRIEDGTRHLWESDDDNHIPYVLRDKTWRNFTVEEYAATLTAEERMLLLDDSEYGFVKEHKQAAVQRVYQREAAIRRHAEEDEEMGFGLFD